MKITHGLLNCLFAIFLLPFTIFSAGIIDQTFGSNGTLNLNFGNQTNVIDIETKPDGKIVVAGTIANATSGKDIVAAQFNSNGTPDTTFGTNGVTISVTNLDETITDLEIGTDGKIVLVGQRQVFEGVNTIFDFLVVRFDAKGLLDNSFGNGGFVTANQNQPDRLNRVTVLPNGKIVVVGTSDEDPTVRGFLRLVIMFNSNGSIDSNFGIGGFSVADALIDPSSDRFETGYLDIEPYPGDRFVVGYNFFDGHPDEDDSWFYIQTFTQTGESTSYIGGGAFDRQIQATTLELEVLSDGRIVAAHYTGVYIGGRRYTPRNGDPRGLSTFSNGRFVVSGGSSYATTKLFSPNAFVGGANGLPTGKTATQPNDKFIVLSNNSLTRIAKITSQATRIADFGTFTKNRIMVYRQSTNRVYDLNTNGALVGISPTVTSGFKFIPEFFAYINVYGNYISGLYVYRSNNIFFPNAGPSVSFGNANDLTVGGDYDGDGITELSLFTTDGDWLHRADQFSTTTRFFHWGTTGDKPVPADYDYDGITDYAVYRPSTGTWWIHRSSDDSSFGIQFGLPTDIPLTGDYDADGKADLAVFRPSNGFWYLLMTTDGFKAVQFGISTDIPVPGDYDGDGKHDIAVFRNGIWYLLQSRDGFVAIQWGQAGDVPVTVRYDN